MFKGKRNFLTIVMAVMGLFSAITAPAFSQDFTVKRILPTPSSDVKYTGADYTEIYFRQNKADLELNYMDNGFSLQRLYKVVDSVGTENIAAIEIIAQASPDGILSRNIWLSQHRSQIILDYMNRNFPQLKDRISVNAVTESWDNLASYVAQDPNLSDENKEKVLNIINSRRLSVADKKATIKTVGKDPVVGDVYEYLLNCYYTIIRNAGIYILYNSKSGSGKSADMSPETVHADRQTTSTLSQAITIPAYVKARSVSASLLQVGDTTVRRILPIPESDSTYADADYTEVHFRKNKADLDLGYMNNGRSLQNLYRVIDSLGIENISAVEIIAQASPEGILSRNVWLSERTLSPAQGQDIHKHSYRILG